MLRLNQNSSNKMYLVCDDILTITNPVYLWRIVNSVTREEHLIELENEAEQNQRYDLFTLVLPDDLELIPGEYIYEVFQSATPGNQDFENMPLLADGVMKVLATFTENESYEPTGQDTTYQG